MLHTHLKYTENANNCRFYDATDFQFPIWKMTLEMVRDIDKQPQNAALSNANHKCGETKTLYEMNNEADRSHLEFFYEGRTL